jgi:undecaprenyl-diphosphatase
MLLVTAGVLTLGEWARRRRLTAAMPAANADRRVWQGDWIGPDAAPSTELAPILGAGHDPEDPNGKDLERLGVREAVIIGLAQSLALLPGLSRAGSTITGGMLAGLTRLAATRFSFLLALPAMLGAAVVSLPGLGEPGPYSGSDIVVGVLASFIAGYLAIAFLIRLVARAGLTVFVRYLVAAAAIGWLGYAMLGPVSSV